MIIETVRQYQLEEKMGGGSWSRVRQTKDEAYPEDERTYVGFPTLREAAQYVTTSGRWSADALARKVVRLVEVKVTRRLVRPPA